MDQTAQTDRVFNKFYKCKLFFSDLGGQLTIGLTICALSAQAGSYPEPKV